MVLIELDQLNSIVNDLRNLDYVYVKSPIEWMPVV
jgi:hypothetical protein